jgi:reactive intermediate/imine deaminase
MDASDGVRRAVETQGAPAPIGPYSQAVEAGGVLYCSGQVPLDPSSGELIDGDITEQARRCLENLDAVCLEAGTRLDQAARIGIYLTDMSLFAEVNQVYGEYFLEPFPARTTLGVAELPKGALIEMDATVPLR